MAHIVMIREEYCELLKLLHQGEWIRAIRDYPDT